MATQRDDLYSRLREVLGSEPAATLMTLLPGENPDLTRADLDEAVALLRLEMAKGEDLARFATKDDLARFATKDDLARFATKDDLARFATKDDLTAAMTELRSAIDGVHLAMHGYVRTFLVVQTSTIVAMVGMVLAFDRLL